jgi:hypothetical protein
MKIKEYVIDERGLDGESFTQSFYCEENSVAMEMAQSYAESNGYGFHETGRLAQSEGHMIQRVEVKQCCRQDPEGELVAKGEESKTDVTLAIISDSGEVCCMECGAQL